MTVIWGDRIGLRPFEEPISDAEAARVYRWCCDEQLLRWSGGEPTELSLTEFRERLRGDHQDVFDERRVFFILTRPFDSTQDGALIGRIGCFAIDWDHCDGELGIVIGETAEWGKGYGREAVLLLVRHLFDTTPLQRVYLFTYPKNVRAQRCFTACGFRVLGQTRRFSVEYGEHDGVEMEITRREFLERRNTGARVPAPMLEQCPGDSSSR